MAKSEPQVLKETGEEDYTEEEDSGTEDCNTDDSEEDPSYDILEKTRSSLSKLSLKKSKSRTSKIKDSDKKRKLDFEEVKMPELDEVDEKSFEKVEKIIQAGQLEKLKIDQCKVYLRKHGLRLTGTKDVLIERIREHLGVINGGGEQKYPVSSFVLNCKGDACTRDVVMFEQNVYEMYNVASRSASGPPCGTRVVAGRIVKESYGAAKQQHTFTIEVLWSKGVKPLPPLHPLLIKGRNLYRLKTMRQKWTDEAERSKVLLEKHSRGSLARSSRETRIQEKETKKMLKGQRTMRNKSSTFHKENHDPQPNTVKFNSSQHHIVQTQILQKPVESAQQPNRILTEINQQTKLPQANHIKPQMNYIPQQKISISENPIKILNYNVSRTWWGNISELDKHMNTTKDHQSYVQSYPNLNSPPRSPLRPLSRNQPGHIKKYQNGYVHKQPLTSSNSLPRSTKQQQNCRYYYAQGRCNKGDTCKFLHAYTREQSLNVPPRSSLHQFPGTDNPCHGQRYSNADVHKEPLTSLNLPPRSPMRQQPCRYYAYGGCHKGGNCKYLHEYRREQR